jgi:hypothetical protein
MCSRLALCILQPNLALGTEGSWMSSGVAAHNSPCDLQQHTAFAFPGLVRQPVTIKHHLHNLSSLHMSAFRRFNYQAMALFNS